MASVAYEAVAIVGKRKDDKPNYVRIGTVFKTERGLSMKLDAIPAGNEWNGWVSLFEPKAKEDRPAQSQPSRKQAPASGIVDDDLNEIPF